MYFLLTRKKIVIIVIALSISALMQKLYGNYTLGKIETLPSRTPEGLIRTAAPTTYIHPQNVYEEKKQHGRKCLRLGAFVVFSYMFGTTDTVIGLHGENSF